MDLHQIETEIARNRSEIAILQQKERELESQLAEIVTDGKEPRGHEVILRTVALEVTRLKAENLELEMNLTEIALIRKRARLIRISSELRRLDIESDHFKQSFQNARQEIKTSRTKLNQIASEFSQLEQEGQMIAKELGVDWTHGARLHSTSDSEIEKAKTL